MNKKLIVAVAILGIGLLSILGALLLKPIDDIAKGPGKEAMIGVINIEGLITGSTVGGSIFGAGAGSRQIMEHLKEARENPAIKVVVLRINSPGGSAPASQEIGDEVDKLRKAGKKIIASMGDTAASGGYWIAAKADKIMANPATITGSIGVIIDLQNLQELYGKIGVKPVTFKSGPHKDMGSGSRPLTQEEQEIFQAMVDDIYNQFVDVVAKGRKMDENKVRELADGRIFTGRQAQEIGLIDQLGNYYDALDLAADMAGIKGEPTIYQFGKESPWGLIFSKTRQALGSFGEEGLTAREILLLRELLQIPAGN